MAKVTGIDKELYAKMCKAIDDLADLREADKKARAKNAEERQKNNKPGRVKLYTSPYKTKIKTAIDYLKDASDGKKTDLMTEITKFMNGKEGCKTVAKLKELAKDQVATYTLTDPDLEEQH